MFLQSNRAFTKILAYGRDNNKWTPVKHLYNNGIKPPIREMEDAGLLHVRYTKDTGFSINLSAKGYKEALGILGR